MFYITKIYIVSLIFSLLIEFFFQILANSSSVYADVLPEAGFLGIIYLFFFLMNMLVICNVYSYVIIINLCWTLRVYLFAAISYGPAESDNQIPDTKVTETAHGLITLRNILRIRYMPTPRNHDFGGPKR